MVYRKFSTESADYVLQLGNHISKNNHCNGEFDGIDALVLETGKGALNDYLYASDYQYSKAINLCKEIRIPVFGADVEVKISGFARSMANLVGLAAMSPKYLGTFTMPAIVAGIISPSFYCAFSKRGSDKTDTKIFTKLTAQIDYLLQNHLGEGRNAASARKIEEFIAPTLAERLGEKPKIGLIYGAGHAGIEQDLKSKRRRDITLWNMRNLNFGKWAGLKKEQLNFVEEGNFNCWGWGVRVHRPELFKL